MSSKRKLAIAKEFERVTFMTMKGVDERSEKELREVLRYTKSILPKERTRR